MASPKTPSGRQRSRPSQGPSQPASLAKNDPPEVVDPVWLLKAIGITLVAALVCGYLTLCLLFYQGQWQLVLHPSRSQTAPASIGGGRFQIIHFGVDETANPQLTGWFIPAEPAARYAAYTILYLPSGDGSLADILPTLSTLRDLGVNVFAFDYRGYGQSAPIRPNQLRMTEDAASAWRYLTVSRAVPASHVVLFGDGVGCALAAWLAGENSEVPAVIFQSPRPAVIQDVLADARVKSLPVRALFHEDFEITSKVANLKTPKLFLLNGEAQSPSAGVLPIQRLTANAASPKMVAIMNRGNFDGPLYREQIARFLDQYLR